MYVLKLEENSRSPSYSDCISYSEMRLQEITVPVIIKTNSQSKVINAVTMIPYMQTYLVEGILHYLYNSTFT